MAIPTLHTDRLILRSLGPSDALTVRRLAGDRAVASTTLNIPHPYPEGAAEEWIATHAPRWEDREALVLGVRTEEDGIVGAIGLELCLEHRRAELGYWIGVPFWNRGYATEAAEAVLDFGFDTLDLNRVEAQALTRNPASERVLEKLGMKREGVRRQHIVKWDTAEDVALYAVLAAERGP